MLLPQKIDLKGGKEPVAAQCLNDRVAGQGRNRSRGRGACCTGWVAYRLSPNHRVLLTDWRAELLLGQSEVLVAVKYLENDHSILQQNDCQKVTYFHILFDQHQTVMSNGLETESLYPGLVAMGALDDDAEDVLAFFPKFVMTLKGYGDTSHPVLKRFEAQALNILSH